MLSGDIARHIQQIYETYGKAQVIADSADPRLIDEIFRYGVNIKKVVKPTIEYSIELMKKQRLNITKQSTNMVNEFYGYVYIKDKNGNSTNQPVDYNNHTIDAARYAAINHLSMRSANRGKYSISIL
jgi:phage terminase large subunit